MPSARECGSGAVFVSNNVERTPWRARPRARANPTGPPPTIRTGDSFMTGKNLRESSCFCSVVINEELTTDYKSLLQENPLALARRIGKTAGANNVSMSWFCVLATSSKIIPSLNRKKGTSRKSKSCPVAVTPHKSYWKLRTPLIRITANSSLLEESSILNELIDMAVQEPGVRAA